MKSESKFILSKKAVLDQYNLASRYADVLSYSFKTNKDVGYVLKDKTQATFSIHALDSIEQLDCPERIWFFGQAWDDEELDYIFEHNITNLVVDNIEDLKILVDYIEKNDKNINLLLRMKLKENTVHTGKHFVFGMYSAIVKEWIPKLKDNQHIEKLGIHFHRKTQNVSEWSLTYELERLFTDDFLKNIDIVNIGGGLPSKYKNYQADVLDGIFEKITEFREWLNSKNIKLIIEPGRFISAPSMKLETTIKGIYNNNIIVDCSVYAGCMDTFVSHIRLSVQGELPDGQGQPYTIKGKTPCSIDIFRYRVWLDNPKVGDKIVFENAGAYTYWTDFCGLDKIPIEVVE